MTGSLFMDIAVVVLVVATIAMIVWLSTGPRRASSPFFIWLDGVTDVLLAWWTFEWLFSLDFDLNLDFGFND